MTQRTLMCNYASLPRQVPSNQRDCAECGAGIWVSDTLTPMVDRGELRPLCLLCMKTFVDGQADVEFQIEPTQTAELAEYGALGAADQLVAELNARYRVGPRFYCPQCGWPSSDPNDVAEQYCGHCHDWTGHRDDG